jgi:hypothetical protein
VGKSSEPFASPEYSQAGTADGPLLVFSTTPLRLSLLQRIESYRTE